MTGKGLERGTGDPEQPCRRTVSGDVGGSGWKHRNAIRIACHRQRAGYARRLGFAGFQLVGIALGYHRAEMGSIV